MGLTQLTVVDKNDIIAYIKVKILHNRLTTE